MNTKLKNPATSTVGRRNLGRPVGVLPLPMKPVIPVECHNGTRVNPRRIKRTSSTGSVSSVKSVRPARPDSGSKSKNSSCEKSEEDVLEGGSDQDVKFFNVESSSRPSSGTSQLSISRVNDQSSDSISWQEILERSQESDPYKVYEIILHGEDLRKIPDLEKFRKLRVLDVSGNKIRKIENLNSNKDLRDLKLYDNNLSTIDHLENLKELSSLQLQHNKIKKIGNSLSCLKKLCNLRLDSNKLTKLETPELVSCSNITSLDISNNRIESLSALNYLPNLEELGASGNDLSKVGSLNKCRRLQDVDLSHNHLSDLNGLSNLPNLKILDVSYNRLDSLKSLGKLKSLEELNMTANCLSSLSHMIPVCPKLQILNISDNRIEKWDEICALSGLNELVELFASGNPFGLEDGEMPTYHLHVTQVLPSLEIIDGIQIHKKTTKQGAAPLMRPMSAASVITVRQVDAQLDNVAKEQETLQKDISERFESLRALFDKLPSELPTDLRLSQSESQSRCSSRARLREAQNFAAQNFEDVDDVQSI